MRDDCGIDFEFRMSRGAGLDGIFGYCGIVSAVTGKRGAWSVGECAVPRGSTGLKTLYNYYYYYYYYYY